MKELRVFLLMLLVFIAIIGNADALRFGGRSSSRSSSRGSYSRGSSSRPSSSRPSSSRPSSSWPSSSRPSSSWPSSSRPSSSWPSSSHPSSSWPSSSRPSSSRPSSSWPSSSHPSSSWPSSSRPSSSWPSSSRPSSSWPSSSRPSSSWPSGTSHTSTVSKTNNRPPVVEVPKVPNSRHPIQQTHQTPVNSPGSHRNDKDVTKDFINSQGGGAQKPRGPPSQHDSHKVVKATAPPLATPAYTKPPPYNPYYSPPQQKTLNPPLGNSPSSPYNPHYPQPSHPTNSHPPPYNPGAPPPYSPNPQSYPHGAPPPYSPNPQSYPHGAPPPYSPNPQYPPPYSPLQPSYHQTQPHYAPQPPPCYPSQVHPATNVVLVPQVEYRSSSSTGEMFKNALIQASVHEAVHRIVSPRAYQPNNYYDNNYYRESYPARPPATHTESHVTINNYNPAPGNNGAAYPSTVGGNVNPIGGYPTNANPNVQPTGGNYPNVPYPPAGVNGSPAIYPVGNVPTISSSPVDSVGEETTNDGSVTDPARHRRPHHSETSAQANSTKPEPTPSLQYKISNEELWNLTETIFVNDENNAFRFIELNMQNQSLYHNGTDEAPQPLFNVTAEAYAIPTVQMVRSMMQNYNVNSTAKETVTGNKRRSEQLLLDVFLSTSPMAATMKFLAQRGFVEDDYFEQKDTLKRIWFTLYGGTSSAFERVFLGEVFNGTFVYGVQDWIYFSSQESSKEINYLGYIGKEDLGDKAMLLKLNFKMQGVFRPAATIFIGISPELEMSLYTLCYYTRPLDNCHVSLGGKIFTIFTKPMRYFGKDLVDYAYPLI